MDNRDRDQRGNKSPDSDSDVGFGKNTDRSESFDEESGRGSGAENIEGSGKHEEDIEKYEDTTPMSNRGTLREQ